MLQKQPRIHNGCARYNRFTLHLAKSLVIKYYTLAIATSFLQLNLKYSSEDRIRCPAIQGFVRSISNSDLTLSVDRPLFAALTNMKYVYFCNFLSSEEEMFLFLSCFFLLFFFLRLTIELEALKIPRETNEKPLIMPGIFKVFSVHMSCCSWNHQWPFMASLSHSLICFLFFRVLTVVMEWNLLWLLTAQLTTRYLAPRSRYEYVSLLASVYLMAEVSHS